MLNFIFYFSIYDFKYIWNTAQQQSHQFSSVLTPFIQTRRFAIFLFFWHFIFIRQKTNVCNAHRTHTHSNRIRKYTSSMLLYTFRAFILKRHIQQVKQVISKSTTNSNWNLDRWWYTHESHLVHTDAKRMEPTYEEYFMHDGLSFSLFMWGERKVRRILNGCLCGS